MATKRVPATITDIADAIEKYLRWLLATDDPFMKVIIKEQFDYGIEKQDSSLLISISSHLHSTREEIECTDTEIVQAIVLLRQQGRLPTPPYTDKEINQARKIIRAINEEERKRRATEPTE